MKSSNDYIERINRVIAWYRGVDKFDATKENLETLNAARRRLACSLAELGKDVSEAKAEREKADFNRKRHFADRMLTHRVEGLTVSESESKARLDNQEHEDAYCNAIQIYENLRLLYTSVNEILNAISSDLRDIENQYKRINQAQPV